LFGAIGADRVGAAQAAAIASGAVVVLKGAETIIADPDGRAAVNIHAAPWLATAGSGDALTGIIAGLIATGLAPFDAARAGVWLHGDCGVRGGPGLIADDIPALLPAVLAAL
jgi:NAD(P)H-hydrate epimerase